MVSDGGNYKDLPKELHSIRKVNIAWTRLNSGKPSYTIDTGHNHIFHYKFNRVPTAVNLRASNHSRTILFFSERTRRLHPKQIGNAVPPMLASAVAKELLKYIQ